MFYPNHQALGDQLAKQLKHYYNNETIIFCIKRSSLLSCLELAAHLHAFIYILQYTEIDDPYNITRPLGAITAKGDFVLNPEISNTEYEYIQSEFMGVIEQRKQQAFSKINAEQDLNPNFNPNSFNHRNILIFADILNTTFQIQIALDTLKPYTPLNIYGAFGNITLPISDKLQLEANGLTYMDILASTAFDDEHYFDQPDQYTDEQKINMAHNISLYWA